MKKRDSHLNKILHWFTLSLILFTGIHAYGQTPPADTVQQSQRVQMPIYISYDQNRVTPYIIIGVNNVKLKVIFDTGSHGLKILKGALAKASLTATGKRMRCSFGSGIKGLLYLKGDVVQGQVTIGGLSANINMMSVDSAEYGTGEIWQSTGDSAIITSTHFRELPAIMGVGLRAEGRERVGNPLAMLPGNGKYIIKFPYFNNDKGQLIINPVPADATGFTYYQLPADMSVVSNDYPAWQDTKDM